MMARPREFDEAAVLDAAIERFWQRGYEATSVRDLADEMNIAGASLYNAFGDKRSLYDRALNRYLDRSFRERIRRLEPSLPPREAIVGVSAGNRQTVSYRQAASWLHAGELGDRERSARCRVFRYRRRLSR